MIKFIIDCLFSITWMDICGNILWVI